MPDKRKFYANTDEMMKAKREAADKTAEDFAGEYGEAIEITEEIPKEFRASPDMLTEDELFGDCEERAKEFDANTIPPDDLPEMHREAREAADRATGIKINPDVWKESDASPEQLWASRKYPLIHSNFIDYLIKTSTFLMSKEIPMMASKRDLRDLTIEDVGLLAFLECIPEIGDADPEMAFGMPL